MKKIIRISVIVILAGLFLATLGYLYQKSKKKPVIYETKSPFISDIQKKTVATGSVVPRKEIEIKPQVSGIIERIYVEPGDLVKEGNLIAKVKIIPNMVNLNNAESRLKRAKITFEDTKLVYDRQKKIYEQGVIPEAEFQRYRLDYKTAIEEL
ncbi:MAG: efflux RND transporter periplasmic adaptor subunit [Bacteroidota bacterium]